MLALIRTLLLGDKVVIPRTRSTAVTMEDGTTLEFAYKNSSTDYVKITADVANAFGIVEGASLSTVLMNNRNTTANVLAAAEVIE